MFNDVGLSTTNKPSPLCNRQFSSLSCCGPSPLFQFHRSTSIRFCLLILPKRYSRLVSTFLISNFITAREPFHQLSSFCHYTAFVWPSRLSDRHKLVRRGFPFIFSSIRPGIWRDVLFSTERSAPYTYSGFYIYCFRLLCWNAGSFDF